jgi:hypothetical protein
MADDPLPKHLAVRWSGHACGCAIIAAVYLSAAAIQLRYEWGKDGLVFEPVGPFARYVYSMAIAGWLFTVVAGILGFLAKDREWSRTAIVLSNACLTIVTIIAVATLVFLMQLAGTAIR